jgi:hypothetical protein
LTTPTPSLVDPWFHSTWPFVSHAMEMNAPEILICESALKVKIEQSYGILNRHKVCPNEFQVKKKLLNLSTFSFCFCVLLPKGRRSFLTTPTPSLVDP